MKIQVTIQGITPLLMNRFTEHNEVAVSSGTSVNFKGDRGTPRQQAEPKRYADGDGKLYIPGPNIFACIIAAGTFHKAGKSKLTTLRTSLIPAGIMVDDLVCNLTDLDGDPLTEWEVDSRSVVIPSTGGRIMCHRPRVDVWAAKFTLDVDETMFSPSLVRAVVDDAGKKIGLGDFRPARKGPFGRFVVSRWEIVKDGGGLLQAA
ncbi:MULTISPECIES: hypothetical protein [Mesorhizobium]|uniref:hypothetical protein n=1 Tax=Mesorhizobium TaxID=68287 RepID=UPI0007A95444|nr:MULTISPECIES: hypothetical protein [Mesorhizobium]AMX93640.1 hypothetical protein A4R28_11285 [Mesorhizobium ciceri]MDF3208331.1 hypothetical protein [Mesorhizobium sp. LMG15046]MDF3229097.1 hypothetical protein [Mesorhizobium sp. DSM 30133]RUU22206.1 hypothetical protein EOC84_03605 [Mesorhizobium sp. Primo-B]RUU37884.1 hypothetical protein EOC83_16610 [Mesorhizobium sp. Primo-A]